MFLMIFNIGIVESGFPSINAFIIYLVGNTVLMLSYWIIWMLYFNKQTYREQMALAVIPTGILLTKWYNNVTLFFDYICSNIWDWTYLCYKQE